MERISKALERMDNNELRELLLGVCENDLINQTRVTKCLDNLERAYSAEDHDAGSNPKADLTLSNRSSGYTQPDRRGFMAPRHNGSVRASLKPRNEVKPASTPVNVSVPPTMVHIPAFTSRRRPPNQFGDQFCKNCHNGYHERDNGPFACNYHMG